jgi:MFS family permease
VREYTVLIIAGTLTMLSGGMSFPIFAPYVKQEFTAPLLLVGMAVSGYFLLRMFSELPFGALSDKIGPRKPLLFGRVLAIIGALLCWIATDVYQLIVARALWGVGDAAFFCISTAYISTLFPVHERGRALGIFTSIEMIGAFLGQSIGGILVTPLGFRNIFLLNSVLGSAAFFLVSMVRSQAAPMTFQWRSILPSWTTIRSAVNSVVMIVCFMNFSLVLRNNGITSTLFPLYVTEELNISLAEYGFLMASSTVGSVLGASVGGTLSDRLGRKTVLVFGFGLGLVTTALLAVVRTLLVFFPVMVMNGLFWGIIYSVTPVLVSDSVPPAVRGTAIGAYRTFFDFGGLAGPVVMSLIAEGIGLPYGYIIAFYVGASLMFVNLLVALMIRPLPTTPQSS